VRPRDAARARAEANAEMSCRRAFDIDLAAFLANPREAELADFVDHYPVCPECAAEVRTWTELEATLREAPPSAPAHPEPEQLARFAEAPNSIAASERGPLDAHLAACPICRDEVAGLRRFLETGVPAAPDRVADAALVPRGAGPLRALRRLLWHPGFAYAALGLVLVSTLYRSVGPGGVVRDEVLGTARQTPERSESASRARAGGLAGPGGGDGSEARECRARHSRRAPSTGGRGGAKQEFP
jgi:anti-sigma factor RsiW